MNKIVCRAAIALAATTAAASPAYAASTSQNLNVSANVTANCVISAPALNFGSFDATLGASHDMSTNLSVTCTNGVDWTVTADAGAGTGATIAQRLMTDSEDNVMEYNLYTDAGHTSVWGTGVDSDGASITETGSGVAQTVPIYGRVALGQTDLAAGTYTDTVSVTVSY